MVGKSSRRSDKDSGQPGSRTATRKPVQKISRILTCVAVSLHANQGIASGNRERSVGCGCRYAGFLAFMDFRRHLGEVELGDSLLGLEHVADLVEVLVGRSSTDEEVVIVSLLLLQFPPLVKLLLVPPLLLQLPFLQLAQLIVIIRLSHLHKLRLVAAMDLCLDDSASKFNLIQLGGLRLALHLVF